MEIPSSPRVTSYDDGSNSIGVQAAEQLVRLTYESSSCPGEPLLIRGEKLSLRAEPVTFLHPCHPAIPGVFFVTNYRAIFVSYKTLESGEVSTQMENDTNPVIYLGNIMRVEKGGGQKKAARSGSDNSYTLHIVTKIGPIFRFAFLPQNHCRRSVLSGITKFINPRQEDLVFAFAHHEETAAALKASSRVERPLPGLPKSFESRVASDPFFDGHFVYSVAREFKRQGVCDTSPWRISSVNSDYSLASTYPAQVVVPRSLTDAEVSKGAQFRSKCRLPALSWMDPKTGAPLVRCSQPHVGMRGKRSPADEATIAAVLETCPDASTVYIMDARPQANVVVNQAMGWGVESANNYANSVIEFMGIDNIHVMRDSFNKLREACYQAAVAEASGDESRWISMLQASSWLEHVQLVLSGSKRVAQLLHVEGQPVVTHCSDGWDRTSQIVTIASIMLDPYYRTCEGFAVLIEKDWLSFGHKFAQRAGHFKEPGSTPKEDQRSPVFAQFLDCVHQLLVQFPDAFEYSDRFLIFVLQHCYSSRFGTFLLNNEKERVDAKISSRTVSIWTVLLREASRANSPFRNPLYTPNASKTALYPSTSLRRIEPWTVAYLSWASSLMPYDSTESQTLALIDQISILEAQAGALEFEIKIAGQTPVS